MDIFHSPQGIHKSAQGCAIPHYPGNRAIPFNPSLKGMNTRIRLLSNPVWEGRVSLFPLPPLPKPLSPAPAKISERLRGRGGEGLIMIHLLPRAAVATLPGPGLFSVALTGPKTLCLCGIPAPSVPSTKIWDSIPPPQEGIISHRRSALQLPAWSFPIPPDYSSRSPYRTWKLLQRGSCR